MRRDIQFVGSLTFVQFHSTLLKKKKKLFIEYLLFIKYHTKYSINPRSRAN